MKAFITGISGFVGAGVARSLLAQGVEVHGLIRPDSASLWRLEGIRNKLHLHHGDLLDSDSVRRIIKRVRPDILFHLAVYGAYPMQQDKEMIMRSSLLSTMSLLDAAREAGVGVVVNTGSSSEYGTKDHPMREEEAVLPNSVYAIGKVAQTLYCQHFARVTKLPIITLRLFSVYGPQEEPTRFIPTLISNVSAGKDMPLAGAAVARDFIHVADVAAAYVAAAAHPELSGEIFNVGSGVQHTLKDAFDMVVALTGSPSKPLLEAYERRSFDTNVWVADTNKAFLGLGFRAKYDLYEGLRATITWLKHGE